MRALLHPLAVIPPLVALLTWLSVRSVGPQGADYVSAQRDVARVSSAEARLQGDVLRARAGLLRDDDPIVADMAELERAAAELRGRAMVPEANRGLPLALQRLVERDAAALERFKTDNALLQNSLAYFDLLDTQLAADDVPPALAAAIRALGNAVLHLTRDPSAPVRDAVRGRLDAVTGLGGASAPHRGEVRLLVVHGGLLARLLPAVDEDLRALSAISTSDLRQTIRRGQDARRMAEEGRAARYRLALYGVALLLAAMLARAGLARRAGIALQLAPQPQHLDVDAAVEDVLVHTRGAEEVLAAERAAWCVEEGDQQRVLALRQRDLVSFGLLSRRRRGSSSQPANR